MSDANTVAQRHSECFCVCCEEVKHGFYPTNFAHKSAAVNYFFADQQRRLEHGCTQTTVVPQKPIFSSGASASAKLLDNINRTLATLEQRAQEEPPNFSDD